MTFACDGCPPDLGARISFVAPEAEYTPPVIYSRESREKLVYPGRGGTRAGRAAPASGPARRRPPRGASGGAMTSPRVPVIDVEGLCKSFGGKRVVRGLLAARAAGRDLRLPRPQRQRQDHHHPDALRPADAGRRPRHLPRPRHPERGRGDQAPGRLHDPALQPVGGPERPREPRLRRPDLRRCRSAARRSSARSSSSASGRAVASSRASCPAAGSSAWRSPPASSTSPGCSCSTSRPRASTRRRGASSGSRSMRSPRAASPSWSAPTTWTRPSAAIGSPIWPTAGCSPRAPSRR